MRRETRRILEAFLRLKIRVMAKIKLKDVQQIIEVTQNYDEVINILNERKDLTSVSFDEMIMQGVPTKRISIVISEIVFIRE